MSKNKTKQDQVLDYLMQINKTLGEHTGMITAMHKKQDYTNGRVNKLESRNIVQDDRVTVMENTQTGIKTKVAIFATVAGVVGTLFINIVKQQFGL